MLPPLERETLCTLRVANSIPNADAPSQSSTAAVWSVPKTVDCAFGVSSVALFVGAQILQRPLQQIFNAVFVRAFERLNRTQQREGFFEGSDGGLLCLGHLWRVHWSRADLRFLCLLRVYGRSAQLFA